jgi:hypothetical protein
MEDQIIDVACRAADKFVTTYYEAIDSNRHLLSQLYGKQSVMVWNGNPLGSVAEITDFQAKLPPCTHKVISYDAQPVKIGAGINLMVTVNGEAKYGDHGFRPFSQIFMLTKQETQCKATLTQMSSILIRFALFEFFPPHEQKE